MEPEQLERMLRLVGSFGGEGAKVLNRRIDAYLSYATQKLRVRIGVVITEEPRTEQPFLQAHYHPITVADEDARLVAFINHKHHFIDLATDWQEELKRVYDSFQSRIYIAKRFFDTP